MDRLAALVPPLARPKALDWADVEEITSVPIPADVDRVVSLYGAGTFYAFMWLLEPACANRYLDVRDCTLAWRHALEVLQEPETAAVLGQLGLEINDLTALASTDNGDMCFWATSPSRGDVVMVHDSRAPEWYVHYGSVSEFLYGVLSGRSPCFIFPDTFPSSSVRFARSLNLDAPRPEADPKHGS